MERLEKGLGRLWRRVRGKKKRNKTRELKKEDVQGAVDSLKPPTPPPHQKAPSPRKIRKRELSPKENKQKENEPPKKQLSPAPVATLTPSSDDDILVLKRPKFSPLFKKKQRTLESPRGPLLESLQQSKPVDHGNLQEEPKKDLYQLYWADLLKRFKETLDEATDRFDPQHRILLPPRHHITDSDDDSHLARTPRRSRDFDKESTYAESVGHESGYMSASDVLNVTRESRSGSEPFSGRFSPSSIDTALTLPQPKIPTAKNRDSQSIDELLESPVPQAVAKPATMPELVEETLKNSVYTTKYITTVFETEHNGMEEVLDDVLDEFNMWLGPDKSLFGVACEVQWSVPEKYRDRLCEIRLKEGMHLALRGNNERLLDLFTKAGAKLPVKLAEAAVDENCQRNNRLNAFQGVYRRSYGSLWPWQHSETGVWHRDYWRPLHRTQAQRQALPSDFLFGKSPELLRTRSLVAVNFVGLELATNGKPKKLSTLGRKTTQDVAFGV